MTFRSEVEMEALTGLARKAALVSLIDEMERNGSWRGETHVSCAVYLLQNLTGVPLGYDDFAFGGNSLSSYGLADDLTAMRADSFLRIKPRDPIGPSFEKGEMGDRLLSYRAKTVCRVKSRVEFVAEALGDRRAPELLWLATALFVDLGSSDRQCSLFAGLSGDMDWGGGGLYERARKVNSVLRADNIWIESMVESVKRMDALWAAARERGIAASR